jgi:acetyl-CoA C-acetyltransferase
MIAFPYTKAMVANNTVDMASAVLLCNMDIARAAGVPRTHLVFPAVVANSHETWKVVNRHELHDTPALRAAGAAAFDHLGLGPDEINHVDLYACFPAIVRMSTAALGFDEDRQLTQTGGLGFAGGAVGNATGHSIAAMAHQVRQGGYGLVHGNGGNATKHSVAIYAPEICKRFTRIDCNSVVEHQERAEIPEDWAGPASIEAATVAYGRAGPSHLFAAVLRDDGARGWAVSRDPGLIDDAIGLGVAGRHGRRSRDGEFHS